MLYLSPIQSGMFADDVALWTSIFTKDTNEMNAQLNLLQHSLNNVLHWANKWKMVLAADKTQCITFRHQNKKKFPKLNLTLQGSILQEFDHVKYLGLFLDSHMTYSKHVNYVHGKAARKLGYLTYLCSFKGVRPSLSVYNLLYKTIIRPSLEYGCAFWNGAAESHKKKLDRIQRIALCRILGVMNATAYDTVNVISQIPPLELRRRQEEVKLYQKCVKWSGRFHGHNLVMAYEMWNDYKNKSNLNYISWTGKLSALSRGCIHAAFFFFFFF